jgi:pimeloyl-ACP methyl ester carboxylesterase
MKTGGARQTPGFRSEVAQVNGINIHYVATGAGPLIIFLHGFPEFWFQWKRQLTDFGRDYLAVAPDMRGYNLSDKPEGVGQYELSHLMEDVGGLARHLGHEKFCLVGHDWGGVVAWSFAIACPERVEKLVVINAPHPGLFAMLLREDPAQQRASQYMMMLESEKAEDVLSASNFAVLDRLLLSRGLKNCIFTEQDRESYLDAWRQPGALTGALNYYRAARLSPFESGGTEEPFGFFASPLSELTVKVPVLVIWGEQDLALVPRNLEGLPELVPDLTIKCFPDATHWVTHEKPDAVNACIREFLSR